MLSSFSTNAGKSLSAKIMLCKKLSSVDDRLTQRFLFGSGLIVFLYRPTFTKVYSLGHHIVCNSEEKAPFYWLFERGGNCFCAKLSWLLVAVFYFMVNALPEGFVV